MFKSIPKNTRSRYLAGKMLDHILHGKFKNYLDKDTLDDISRVEIFM